MKEFIIKSVLLFTILSVVCDSNIVTGQSSPIWSKDLQTNIGWQKVTSLGQLVASTGNGLIGINTTTGEVQWTITELKNSPEDSYQPISETPFFTISSDGSKNLYIIDPVAGKILFSSTEAGLDQVSDKYFLYQSSKILVIGTKGKNTEMVMVDMTNGKKLWSKSGAYSFTTGAKDLGNNEVLVTSAFFASKLNANTGDEIWKTPLDPKTAAMSSMLVGFESLASGKLTKVEIMAQLITTPA